MIMTNPNYVDIARIPSGIVETSAMQVAHERLFAEFDPDHQPVIKNLQALLNKEDAALIVAVSGTAPESSQDWERLPPERYLGTLTLLFEQSLTQDFAHIPHLAVSHGRQSGGIGSALVRRALDECELRGINRLDLTSKPSKLAAYAVYSKLGFYTRDTINWRYDF